MKKLTLLCLMIFVISIVACSNDDDTNSSDSNSLSGTAWFGTDDDEGEVYTFTTSSNFTFSGDGPTIQGTYTFNTTSGVLTESGGSFNFTISGDVMTVDNGNSSIYIKQ